MAKNRARNDRSNRAEFLQSLGDNRRKLVPDMGDLGMASDLESSSSCARTDAKMLDRDVQMKYDIAKNEEGPLRRTVKVAFQDDPDSKGKQRQTIADGDGPDKVLYPGLDERIMNLETHLSVRYGEHCLCRSCSVRKAELHFAVKYLLLRDLCLTDSNSWKIT